MATTRGRRPVAAGGQFVNGRDCGTGISLTPAEFARLLRNPNVSG